MKHSARPVFLNLTQIELPAGALTSILHRITGVASSVGFLVFAWWLMALSSGPESYAGAMRLPDRLPPSGILIVSRGMKQRWLRASTRERASCTVRRGGSRRCVAATTLPERNPWRRLMPLVLRLSGDSPAKQVALGPGYRTLIHAD